MSELVASMRVQSGELHVLRSPTAVALAHGKAGLEEGETLDLEQARKLCELLTAAMEPDARVGVIGEVVTANEGRLYVKRPSSAAVTIHDNPHEHGLWTMRLLDQVRDVRDALDRATSATGAQ